MKDFVLLNDKILPNDVKCYSCCTTMDLIALVTKDDQIVIHRFLTWQKLFTINHMSTTINDNNTNNKDNDNDKSNKSIVSIQWSPNGKMISIGCEDGSIFIYNIENAKLINKSHNHKHPIHKLVWIKEVSQQRSQQQQQQQQQQNKNGSTKCNNNYVSPPLFLSQIKQNMNLFPSISYYFENSKEENIYLGGDIYDRPFDILICCDSIGIISLLAFGLFKIVTIDLLSLLKQKYSNTHFLIKPSKSLKILDITLTESLNKLSVMIETDNGLFLSVTIDTSILLEKRNEIHEISLQYFLLFQLQQSLDIHIKEITEKWKETQQQLSTKWVEFEKVLSDYGFSSSIEQELIDLLMCGVPSPPTNQFIVNNINIKKLKLTESNCNSIREILIKYILPSFLNIFHIITVLHNNSLENDGYKGLLDTNTVKNILDYCGSFGMRLQSLETLICGIESHYTSFFSWLYKVQCTLNEIQPDRKLSLPFNELSIMSLLKKGLKFDLLFSTSILFSSSSLSSSSPSSPPSNNNSPTFLSSSSSSSINNNNELNQSGNIGFSDNSNNNNENLEFQYKDLKGNFHDLFKDFSSKIFETFNEITIVLPSLFKFENVIPFCLYDKNDTSVSHKFNCSLISHPNDTIYLSIYTTLSNSNRLFICKREDKLNWSFTCYQLNEKYSILDCKFYNNSSLMALVSEDIIKANQKKSTRKNTYLKQYQYNKTDDSDNREYIKLDVNIPQSTILLDLLDTVFSNEIEESFKSREIILKSRISPITFELSTSRKISATFIGKRRVALYDLAEDEEEEEEEVEEEEEE
ncbi:hypothetical protein ACTFIW_002224 [Dictyostelium discoideum]